jgi:hypothetical protein
MASFAGISAAGKSVERLINACFADEQPILGRSTRATLVRTEDFVKTGAALNFPVPGLTIFTYRVDFNKTMRAAWSAVGSIDGRGHLPLDLHFLITPWADNAEYEQRILGKAMECLETTPMFSGPLLYPDPTANWATNEGVQVVLEEISTEAVMRTFDSLPTDYKLSVPYIARVIRLDSKHAFPSPTVLDVIRGMEPSPLT